MITGNYFINKTDEEIIKILLENGIQVRYEPVALVPNHMYIGFRNEMVVKEMSIRDALWELKSRETSTEPKEA